jgi:hypothetical protein
LIVALFVLPLGVIGWRLHRRKKAYLAEADEPFTELPLRPPGESVRLRIDELNEAFDERIFLIALSSLAAIGMAIAAPKEIQGTLTVSLIVIVGGIYLVTARKMFGLVETLWDHRLGFMGERVVGEELNQLLAVGFRVFHDVPFDNNGKKFNIDHVLVGPPGVYAIETKAWRKPAHIRGLEKARIYSDGICLRHPTFDNTTAIPQARRNAADLAKLLTSATGESVVVSAILTFPGWSVIREKASDVNVLRPDEIKRSFPKVPKQPLSAQQIQRIAHQLEQLCMLTKGPASTG